MIYSLFSHGILYFFEKLIDWFYLSFTLTVKKTCKHLCPLFFLRCKRKHGFITPLNIMRLSTNAHGPLVIDVYQHHNPPTNAKTVNKVHLIACIGNPPLC